MPQSPTPHEITSAIASAASEELAQATKRIHHCLNQLTDDQIWSRPHDSRNSIGNLILHLCGNLRQWVVSAIGGAPDIRNRPEEFSQRQIIPKSDLLNLLDTTVQQATTALNNLTPENLLRIRPIQDFQVTGLTAAFHTTCHFQGHTQEIISMTRTLLGDAYRFFGRSATSH